MSKLFCTFLLGGHVFGVEVAKVREVFRYQEMTRVPLAPNAVQGLINLRGQIVTATDMRRALEMPERPPGDLPMNVVVHSEDDVVSLLVDEIGDVVEADEDAVEVPPDTLTGVAKDVISAVYKLEDYLLLVLDTEKAIHGRMAG